jgi:hypothetical protein
MTRGRPPLLALKEAYGIAMKRGKVLPVSEGRCDHFHFIIFSGNRVTFVKVKRMLSDLSDTKEILEHYEREVRHLARVPQNDVDAREFWARSPRGTFHFFLIDKDRLFEIQADGSLLGGTGYPLELPIPKSEPAPPAKKANSSDKAPALPDREDPPVAKTPAHPAQSDPVPEQVSGEG